MCLGAQLLAEAAGAPARRAPEPEIGWHDVEVTAEGAADPLLAPLAPRFSAFQWHSYEFPLPPGARALARSPVCLQAFRAGSGVGIQFHAEVSAADAQDWIDDYRSPRTPCDGVDPEALRHDTRVAIDTERGGARSPGASLTPFTARLCWPCAAIPRPKLTLARAAGRCALTRRYRRWGRVRHDWTTPPRREENLRRQLQSRRTRGPPSRSRRTSSAMRR